MSGYIPGIEEQEDQLREAEQRQRACRRFDEGLAEYHRHREEEELQRVEDEELGLEPGECLCTEESIQKEKGEQDA